MDLKRTLSCLPRRAASCPAPAFTTFEDVTDSHVSDPIHPLCYNDDDCVSSFVPRYEDCSASVNEEDEEEVNEEVDGEALLKQGDTVSPKSRGGAAHQISRSKRGGGASHQISRTKSGGGATHQISRTKSRGGGGAATQGPNAAKYIPRRIEKNPNQGSPRSPTSQTFGEDLLQAPFQKLAPKRLEEQFRLKNRQIKQACQAGLACQNGK
jgi:hypothetical protein